MTNIKARGFESPSHLREHLDELEQESPAEDPSVAEAVLSPAEEIAERGRRAPRSVGSNP